MKTNKEKLNKSCSRLFNLFNQEVLEDLKEKKFSGKLYVIWVNGDIEYCNLSIKLEYKKCEDSRYSFHDFI